MQTSQAVPPTVTGGRPGQCPECGHEAGLTVPEFSLFAFLRRQPRPYTCAHTTVEQDALVDDYERCRCRSFYHA